MIYVTRLLPCPLEAISFLLCFLTDTVITKLKRTQKKTPQFPDLIFPRWNDKITEPVYTLQICKEIYLRVNSCISASLQVKEHSEINSIEAQLGSSRFLHDYTEAVCTYMEGKHCDIPSSVLQNKPSHHSWHNRLLSSIQEKNKRGKILARLEQVTIGFVRVRIFLVCYFILGCAGHEFCISYSSCPLCSPITREPVQLRTRK